VQVGFLMNRWQAQELYAVRVPEDAEGLRVCLCH